MINLKEKNKGLTLVELMVSLTLLLLVLGIGYNFYQYINKSYKDTENKWIMQREVRKAADFISSELRNVYSLEIRSSVPSSGKAGEYDLYIDSGAIKFRDGTNAPVIIAQGGLNIMFDKAKNKDNAVNGKVLSYEIKATDINYSIKSAVVLSNLPEADTITSTSSGTAVHFKSASDITSIPSADLEAFCFIATAAYGSNTEPSVMLLRQFRDEVLLKSGIGTKFVKFYYKNSPSIAQRIAGNKILKYATRILLMPIVGGVVLFMHKEVYLLLMLFVLLKIYMDRKKKPGLY
jgi:prepilin-type N-terminal cleavage/methylation domain-containing protein